MICSIREDSVVYTNTQRGLGVRNRARYTQNLKNALSACAAVDGTADFAREGAFDSLALLRLPRPETLLDTPIRLAACLRSSCIKGRGHWTRGIGARTTNSSSQAGPQMGRDSTDPTLCPVSAEIRGFEHLHACTRTASLWR